MTMRIRISHPVKYNEIEREVGTVIDVTDDFGKRAIAAGYAVLDGGPASPLPADPFPQYTTAAELAAAQGEAGALAAHSQSGALAGMVESMRPRDYVATYYVDAAGVSVPALRLFTDLEAAIEAARLDVRNESGSTTASDTNTSGHRWRLITVAPGTYKATVVLPQHTALIGLGEKPTDVRIWHDAPGGIGSTVAFRGIFEAMHTCMVSNLWFDLTLIHEQWHTMRGGGSPANTLVPLAVLCDRVKFSVPDGAPMAQQVIDQIVGPNSVYVWNQCEFVGASLPQTVSCLMSGGAGLPSKAVFIDCHSYGNHLQWVQNSIADLEFFYAAGARANMIGLTDLGSPRDGDLFIWAGGTFDHGEATDTSLQAPVDGDVVANDENSGTMYVNWQIDPTVTRLNITGSAVDRVVREITPPLLINGGLSDRGRAYYGASDTDAPLRIKATTDSGALTAGRIYYIRVPITEALTAGRLSISNPVAAGKVAFGRYADVAGAPAGAATSFHVSSPANASRRHSTSDRPAFVGHRLHPGTGYVWLAVATNNAALRTPTRTDQTGYVVKYASGWDGVSPLPNTPAGLTTLGAGQPFPCPTLWPDDRLSLTPEGDYSGVGRPFGLPTTREGQHFVDHLAVGGAREWVSAGPDTNGNLWQVLVGTSDVYDYTPALPASVTGTATAQRIGDMLVVKATITGWAAGWNGGGGVAPDGLLAEEAQFTISDGANAVGSAWVAPGSIHMQMQASASGRDIKATWSVRATTTPAVGQAWPA